MNDFAACVVSASGVLKGGLGVLGERVSSGVILAGADAYACTRHRKPKLRVMPLA